MCSGCSCSTCAAVGRKYHVRTIHVPCSYCSCTCTVYESVVACIPICIHFNNKSPRDVKWTVSSPSTINNGHNRRTDNQVLCNTCTECKKLATCFFLVLAYSLLITRRLEAKFQSCEMANNKQGTLELSNCTWQSR